MSTAAPSRTTDPTASRPSRHRSSCASVGPRERSWPVAATIAILASVLWLFPVYWMVNTAFKPRSEVMTPTPMFVPSSPTWRNFRVAINQTTFLDNLRNSVVVVGGTLLVSIVVGFLAAAALTRFRFRGRRTLMVLILVIQMLPGTALLIPTFLVFDRIGLLGSYFGLMLAYVALVLPFSIWVLRGFFIAIPAEVEEAARVDGAGTWTVLTRILFPLVLPGTIATSVFAFITAWNDYLIAYTFMKDQDHYTLPVWLASFRTPLTGTDFGGQMAASVLFSVPVVVFFLLVQRRLVTGVSAGAVKG